MSAADAAFASMDASLFEQFGEAGSVVRGAAAAVDVTVVLTHGAARIGEYGQVVGRVTTATFRNAEWKPRAGDLLTVGDVEREVETIDSDDGLVSIAVLFGGVGG